MKKLILLAFVSAFVFNSCRKDDDNNEPTIVGTWKPYKFITKYENGTSSTSTPTPCSAKTNITFANDGKYIAETYGDFSGECLKDDANGTYSYDKQNKILTYTNNGDLVTFEVATLTDTELTLITQLDLGGEEDQFYVYYKK